MNTKETIRVLALGGVMNWCLQITAQQDLSLVFSGAFPSGDGLFLSSINGDSSLTIYSSEQAVTHLTRYDGSGSILWSKAYQLPNYAFRGPTYAKSVDNGAFMGGILPSPFINDPDPLADDTITRGFALARLDENGDVVWNAEFGSVVVGAALDSNTWEPDNMLIACKNTSDLFVVLSTIIGVGTSNWDVFRLDGTTGNLLWGRTIASTLQGVMDVPIPIDAVPIQDGSVIVGAQYAGSGDHLLFRLDSIGNLSWMNRFHYNTPNSDVGLTDLLLLADGRLLLTGGLLAPGSANGHYTYLCLINSDGTFSKALLVPGPVSDPTNSAVQLTNGRLLIQREEALGKYSVLELDTTGAFVVRSNFPDVSNGTSSMQTDLRDIDNSGDLVQLTATTWVVHPLPANTTHDISILRSFQTYTDHCLVHVDTIQSEGVPSNQITVQSVVTASSQVLSSPYVPVVALPIPITNPSPYGVWDLCTWMGIWSDAATVSTPIVFPNPVVAGNDLCVDMNNWDHLTVFDALGRTISRISSRPPGSLLLKTTGWRSGPHILVAYESDGTVVWSHRFIVN